MVQNKHQTAKKAFTLIEVLLSISLMSVALVGVNLLITNGLRSSVDGHDRTDGLCVAQTVTEMILMGRSGFPQGREFRCRPPHQEWLCQWTTQPVGIPNLVKVIVDVRRGESGRDSRVAVRWSQLACVDQLTQLETRREQGD